VQPQARSNCSIDYRRGIHRTQRSCERRCLDPLDSERANGRNGEGNELCIKMCIYIVIAFFIKTVAIFSATYTLQQLNRSCRNKQKNEKTSYRVRLVTSASLLPTLSCTAQLHPNPCLAAIYRHMEHTICASPF
jgi:hypothetical protein